MSIPNIDALVRPTQKIFITLLLLLSIFMLAACQPSDSDNNSSDSGDLLIQLTDAEGDFTNYTVDVISISLTKANNAQVEALPENTRVDFSQYVDMTELLTAATIPSGFYKSVSLTLSYTDSEIYVENSDGDSVKVDNIVDEDGASISTLTTEITFDENKPLKIVPGVPALLSLDFDLKTSNDVSFDEEGVPTVVVSPNLVASMEIDPDKEHRIRGPLQSVNVDDSSFQLHIRPFHHRMDPEDRRFGSIKISTSEETVFDINGESYVGQAGIEAMATVEKRIGVIAKGTVDIESKTFNASEVYIGSSVPGGDMDSVKGTVLSRDGNNLVVKGATLIRAGGSILFQNRISVTIADTTIVRRHRDAEEYDISAISVGQKLTVFGSFNGDFSAPAFDASEGIAHLEVTTVTGQVVSNPAVDETEEVFAIDLRSINGKQTSLFDFTGTGVDETSDADPEFYEVDTGVLNVSDFANTLPVKVKGFPNVFGSAPADFIAKSATGYREIRATANINWVPASNTAFSSISEEMIVVDFTGTGRFHHLSRGRQHFDLTESENGFSLKANDFGEGFYQIHTSSGRHFHATFANFAADVEGLLEQGLSVQRIRAVGKYESLNGEFAANRIELFMR